MPEDAQTAKDHAAGEVRAYEAAIGIAVELGGGDAESGELVAALNELLAEARRRLADAAE